MSLGSSTNLGRGQQRIHSQVYQRGVVPADIASERPGCSKLRHKCKVNEDDPGESKTIVLYRKVDKIDADGLFLIHRPPRDTVR